MNRFTKLSLWWVLALTATCAIGPAGCALRLSPDDGTDTDGGTVAVDAARPDARPDAHPDAVPEGSTVEPGCPLPGGGTCPRNSACWTPDGCSQCLCSADLVLSCTGNLCVDAGRPVDADPPPDTGSPLCRTALDCATGEECAFPAAGCGLAGECKPAIDCGADPQPYCGCDGQTHWTVCFDKVDPWQHDGPCETVDAGPTRCDLSAELGCPAGQACVPDPGCTTQGTCVDFGQCHDDAAEFCDCNGNTFRASSNCPTVMYAHFGACEQPDAGHPRACRNIGNCVAGEACVFPPGCGDVLGDCVQVPTCDTPTPYCACDGTTYRGCVPFLPYTHEGPCVISVDAGVVDVAPPPDVILADAFAVDAVDAALGTDAIAVDAIAIDAGHTDGGVVGSCRGARIGVDGLCYDSLGAPYPLSCCRGYDCNQLEVVCRRLPPNCAPGEVPEIIDGCYGPCVLFDNCAPIACMPGDRACPPSTNCDPSTSQCVR